MQTNALAHLMTVTLSATERALETRPAPDCYCAECGREFALAAIAKCPDARCGSRQVRRLDPVAAALRRSILVMGEAANELRVLERFDLARTLEIRIEQATDVLNALNQGA